MKVSKSFIATLVVNSDEAQISEGGQVVMSVKVYGQIAHTADFIAYILSKCGDEVQFFKDGELVEWLSNRFGHWRRLDERQYSYQGRLQ